MSITNDSLSKFKYSSYMVCADSTVDIYVAEKLKEALASYKLPENVRMANGLESDSIGDVYLYTEGMSDDSDKTIIASAEYMIIICSPAIKHSENCISRIEEFIKVRDREHVLAVLVEGEPCDSFPDQILFGDVEPLATDLRGNDKQKLIKKQYIRILATLFGIKYDDIIQRHKLQRIRKIRNISLGIASVAIVIGIVSTVLMLTARTQRNELAKDQAIALARQSAKAFAEGDKDLAVALATTALTETDGISLPYTDEAFAALLTASGPYNMGAPLTQSARYNSENDIETIYYKDNNANPIVCILNNDNHLSFVDMSTGVITGDYQGSDIQEDHIYYACDDKIVYLTDNHKVIMISVEDGSVIYEEDAQGLDYRFCGNNCSNPLYVVTDTEDSTFVMGAGGEDNVVMLTHAPVGNIFVSDDNNYMGSSYIEEGSNSLVLVNMSSQEEWIYKLKGMELQYVTYDNQMAYAYLNNHDEDDALREEGTFIAAISMTDGEIEWTYSSDDSYAKELYVLDTESGRRLVAISRNAAVVLDAVSGEKISHFALRGSFAGAMVMNGAGKQTLSITNNKGNIVLVSGDYSNGITYITDNKIVEYNIRNIDNVWNYGDNYIAYCEKDRTIAYYSAISYGFETLAEEDYVTRNIDEELQSRDWDRMGQLIVAYHLEDKMEMIANIIEIKNEVIVVSYSDSSAEVISKRDGSIIDTWKTGDDIIASSLGTDIYGNTYLADTKYFGYTYILSPSYRLIGHTLGVAGLNEQKDSLIFATNNGEWIRPIATLEELTCNN